MSNAEKLANKINPSSSIDRLSSVAVTKYGFSAPRVESKECNVYRAVSTTVLLLYLRA